MTVKVFPTEIFGSVQAISSKSYAHRALISAAFLAKKSLKIHCNVKSEDILATVDCLKNLGVNIEDVDYGFVVTPSKTLPKTACLDVRESASTLRFLMPIVGVLNVKTKFILSKSLKNRPIGQFLQEFADNGSSIVIDNGYVTVDGKLNVEKFTVDGSLSSQFVTGVMLAAAISRRKCNISVSGKNVSQGYIDITADVLKEFGVDVKKDKNVYTVCKTRECDIEEFFVEGDYSNAAYFLAMGALSKKISVYGLNILSFQADRRIIDILKEYGAKVLQRGDVVTVEHDKLLPINFDADQAPDLAPVVAVLAANACGTSVIYNISRLRLKETDRVNAIIKMLATAQVKTKIKDDTLYIFGGKINGGRFSSEGDHRMAMAETLLSLCAGGPSIIEGCENVNKSYPRFFDDVKTIGGNDCVFVVR